MQIFIIRHGDPDYDIDGLTETGKIQAAALAEYLKNQSFDGVYSSPLGRAHLTAKACFDEKQITICDWLKEFEHPVTLSDGTVQLNWDFYPEYFCSRDDFYDINKYLDTEEMMSGNVKEAYDWVARSLDMLLAGFGYVRDGRMYRVESSNTKRIVLFCHFGIMTVLMSHLMGVPYAVLAQNMCASPTSITTFATEERKKDVAHFRCLNFGATPHLAVKGLEPSFSARFCEIFDSPDRH